jgi:hypothetical protein
MKTEANERQRQRFFQGIVLYALACLMLLPSSALAAGGSQTTYINSPWADRPMMPTRFSPDNLADFNPTKVGAYYLNNYVRRIQWTSWGGQAAEGMGEVSLLRENGSTSSVTVTLGGLESCAGISVYTTYSLALAPGAEQPAGWPKGKAGRFPCIPSLSDQYQGQRLSRRSNCLSGLYQLSSDPTFPLIATWTPRPPGKYWFLCELRFQSWGSDKAVGSGTVRLRAHEAPRGRIEWPIRIELSQPIWCPRLAGGTTGAITYGRLKIVLQGGQLGNAGNHRRYSQHSYPSLDQCQSGGWPENDAYGNPL